MSVLISLKEQLSNLNTLQIDDNVVQASVDVDFIGNIEVAEFDLEYEDIQDSWSQVIDLLSKLIVGDKNGKSENCDGIIAKIEAATINEDGDPVDPIQLKRVVTVLGFAMEKLKDKTLESCIVSLLAARMYLLLCCLDSAHIFGVFFKSMMTRVFLAFRTAYLRKMTHIGASKPKKTTKSKKNTVIEPSMLSETQIDGVNPEVLEILTTSLCNGLEQFYVFLKHDICQNYIGEIADLLQLICRFDYSTSTSVLPAENLEKFKKVIGFSNRCFALAHLCLSEKINREDSVLAKFCLPRLIFKNFDGQFMRGPLPQSFVQNANVMVEFLKLQFAGKDDCEAIFMKRLAENVIHHCQAEKIDYRQASINVALQLIQDLSQPLIHQFFYFTVNYSVLSGMRAKLMAVDLICNIFDKFDVDEFPTGLMVIEKVDYELFAVYNALEFNNKEFDKKCPGATKYWKKFGNFAGDDKFNARDLMMRVLVRATMDKVSAVRGRALNGVLRFVKTMEGYQELTKHARLFIIDKRTKVVRVLSEVNVHDEKNDGRETQLASQRTETPIPSQIQEGAQQEAGFLKNVSAAPFIDLIIQRCNDKSVVTRKFVIPIIEALLNLEKNQNYQKLLLEKMQDFCRDPSVQVRKLGAEAMTRVVRDEAVYKKAWLHTVLPMVNDRDDSVEKSCRKMFFEKIVCPIVTNDGSDSLSWNLVIEIAKSSAFKRAFRSCFRSIAKDAENRTLLNKLVKVLYGAVKVDAVAKPAWMLLDYLADEFEIDVMVAVHAWIASDDRQRYVDPAVRITNDSLELLSILSVILKKKNKLEPEDFAPFRDNLCWRLLNCKLPPPIISDAIITVIGLVDKEPGFSTEFLGALVEECYNGLLEVPDDDEKSLPLKQRRQIIGRRILTLGQAAMHAPKSITNDIVDLLIHILSVEAPLLDEKRAEAISRPLTRMNYDGTQQNQELNPKSRIQNLPFTQLTTEITAAAVIALGKMILIREDIAQKKLKQLVLIFGASQHAAVRNNCIYILGDCYLKYTNDMDLLQKGFLHGLRDRVNFVRYHALLLTTELLRSQYMKLSALVIARLLPLLLDKDPIIRDALEKETLAVIEEQFPTVYIDHFVTVMFLINRVPYGVYNDIRNLEMPSNPICFLNHNFSGAMKRNERMTIYKFMLKKFDDQQRFSLINNICRTIFGSVVEDKINFETPEVKQLILDGLQVIQLPEAKLQFDVGSKDDDDEADLPPEEIQKYAEKRIKVAFCQGFVQVIMPQFMAMSRFLSNKRSVLQKEFRNCLAVIAESYPDELHLLFQDNAQLKLEVEADLKQRKRDARKSRIQKNKELVQNIVQAPLPENEELPLAEIAVEENAQIEVKQEQLIQVATEQEENNEEEVATGIENISITRQSEENVEENVNHGNGEENEKVGEEDGNMSTFEEMVEKNNEKEINDEENEKMEEKSENEEVFEKEDEENDVEKSLTVIPEIPEKTLVENLNHSNQSFHTAIETTKNKTFAVLSGSDVSSSGPSTPVGPPKKRRKSEVSIHLLRRPPCLDADVPILSPKVTGFNKAAKRIHSTPKNSTDGALDFTFGPEFSMIEPAENSKFTIGNKRPRNW